METGRTHAISFRFALQPLGRSAAVNGGLTSILLAGSRARVVLRAESSSNLAWSLRVQSNPGGRQLAGRYRAMAAGANAGLLDLSKYHTATALAELRTRKQPC
jgi:hypothetical protein